MGGPMAERTRPAFACEGFVPGDAVRPGALHVLGLAFDGTACFRRGARAGPPAVREAWPCLETFSPLRGRDVLDLGGVVDLGDLAFGDGGGAEGALQGGLDAFGRLAMGADALRGGARLVCLGGEHSVSLGPVGRHLEAFDDLLVLHVDAHADLRDGYMGARRSHASVARRIHEGLGPGQSLLQYGVRSGTREEWRFMEERGTLLPDEAALAEALGREPGRPLYLTLDMDVFDPSLCPGTGSPEPGGWGFGEFARLMDALGRARLVGADVVELAPALDPTGASAVLAAKVLREVLLSIDGGAA